MLSARTVALPERRFYNEHNRNTANTSPTQNAISQNNIDSPIGLRVLEGQNRCGRLVGIILPCPAVRQCDKKGSNFTQGLDFL